MQALNGLTYATFRAAEVEDMTGVPQGRQRLEQAKGNLKAPPTIGNKAQFTIEHIAERALVGCLIDANLIGVRQEPAFAKYFEQARQHVQQWALLTVSAVEDRDNAFALTKLGMKVDEKLGRPVTVAEYAAHMREPFRFALIWGGAWCTFSSTLDELTAPDALSGQPTNMVSEIGRATSPVCVVIDLKLIGNQIAARAGRPLAVFTKPCPKVAD